MQIDSEANNSFPAEFIYENLQIQSNIIEGAKISNIKKLVFIGSSCIYPRNCKQPIKEEYLLSGKLESTNQWYAVAKIAGIKMVEAYRKQYNCGNRYNRLWFGHACAKFSGAFGTSWLCY